MERTRSDSRYRPVRKPVSRYGKMEKALCEIKAEKEQTTNPQSTFSPNDVAKRTRCLEAKTVGQILTFTTGVRCVGKRTYVFDGNPIKVCFE